MGIKPGRKMLTLLLVVMVIGHHEAMGFWPYGFDDEDLSITGDHTDAKTGASDGETAVESEEGSGDLLFEDVEDAVSKETTTVISEFPSTTAVSIMTTLVTSTTPLVNTPLPTTPPSEYPSLHTNAVSLQKHLDTCDTCMVLRNRGSYCPFLQVSVEMERWFRSFQDLLSHGCHMGPRDRQRCCVNTEHTVAQMIQDLALHVRDVYYVLNNHGCQACPVDGKWSEWTGWGTCSVTCGAGERVRTRTCTNPAPINNGRACQGEALQAIPCFAREAMDGIWSQWGTWSSCSATCGPGTRTRLRTCSNPPPNACGRMCPGPASDKIRCNLRHCCNPVDGGWSNWFSWSACSSSCGGGFRERQRTCSSPRPNECGRPCSGSDREQDRCKYRECCDWSEWTLWTSCACGPVLSSRKRTRFCVTSSGRLCSDPRYCQGRSMEEGQCQCLLRDTGEASWSQWSTWCHCNCRRGLRGRVRSCLSGGMEVSPTLCWGAAREEQYCDVRKDRICPACITTCKRKNGKYPSCSSCSEYIICSNGQGTVQHCPGRYEWDAHVHRCVRPPSESCSLKAPMTSCHPGMDGYHHVKGSCTSYVQCFNGRVTPLMCTTGKEFNAFSQKCETRPSPTCARPFG